MNEAFIQHAQHDVHRHHRRQDQPQRAAERRLEGQGRPWNWVVMSLGMLRFFCLGDRVHRLAERVAVGDVERNGGRRELIEMVDRQRAEALFDFGDGAQRHHGAVVAAQTDLIERRQPRRRADVVLQHHAVLVGLGVDGGDQALAERVVQRIVHVAHGDAEAGGRIAVDVDVGDQP